jgi:Holliday junction resolvasome RuvABC DNA-binding subunit
MVVRQEEEGYSALMKITGIGQVTAERLYKEGLKSIAAIAAIDHEMLSSIPGVGEKTASLWIKEAAKIINQEIEGKMGNI